MGDMFIEPCHCKQNSAAKQHPEYGCLKRHFRQEKTGDKSERNAGKRNDIRNDIMVDINKGDHHQNGDESKINQRFQAHSPSQEYAECK